MMNIVIENMAEEHIKTLAVIEKECFSTPWSENALKSELANGYARFFTAICDGEVVGYIGAHNILGEVYITDIAVGEKHRGKGVGTALLCRLLSVCEKENAQFVTLEVRRSNHSAINFYEKAGFKKVGERAAFYENPREDAILMTYK